jgi:hypothetical protein
MRCPPPLASAELEADRCVVEWLPPLQQKTFSVCCEMIQVTTGSRNKHPSGVLLDYMYTGV